MSKHCKNEKERKYTFILRVKQTFFQAFLIYKYYHREFGE